MAGDSEKPGPVELSGEALISADSASRLEALQEIMDSADKASADALERLKTLSEMRDEVGDKARAHMEHLRDVFGIEIDAPEGEGVDTDEDEDTDTDTDVDADLDADSDTSAATPETKEDNLIDELSEIFKNAKGENWDEEKGWFGNLIGMNVKLGEFLKNIPAAIGAIFENIFSGGEKAPKESEEAPAEKAPLKAEDVRLIGASLMVNPGKNLKIGEEKIPEGDNEVYVKGGRPTAEMYENMKAEVEAGKFDNVKAVAILAGGNDIGPRPASHVISYLEKMMELFRSVNPNMQFVFVGLPPVTGYYPEVKTEGGGKERRYVWSDGQANERAKEINAWIHTMAEGNGSIAEVDLYSHLEDPAKPGWIKDEYNGDGLHLNSKGYEYMQGQLADAFNSFEGAPA